MVVTSFAEDYTMTVKNALGRTETGMAPAGLPAFAGQALGGVVGGRDPVAAWVELEGAAAGGVVSQGDAPAERVDAAPVAAGGVEQEGDTLAVGVDQADAPAGGALSFHGQAHASTLS